MLEDVYLNLIYRKLEGTITPDEAGQLEGWMVESDENQRTYEDVVAAWEASANLTPDLDLDLDAEFSFLEDRIAGDENTTPTETANPVEETTQEAREIPFTPQGRSLAKRRLYWAAAAGFALLITAGLLMPRFFNSEPNWVELAASDQHRLIKLEDGTEVGVEPGATLRYPEKFSDSERPVEMTGQVSFSVAKDADRPFRVQTQDVQVTVLGTEFVVNTNENQNGTSVFVREGKVEVMSKKNDEKVVLLPSQGALWSPDSQKFSLSHGDNPNAGAPKLMFSEAPLAEVVTDVANYFDAEVNLENPEMKGCPFTARFEDPTIDEVLEAISVVFDIKLEKTEDGKYLLKGGKC